MGGVFLLLYIPTVALALTSDFLQRIYPDYYIIALAILLLSNREFYLSHSF